MTKSSNAVYDLKDIRQQSKEAILSGAVTKDYPLDLEQAHKMLNEALATEIMCVLRYRHHQIVATTIDGPQAVAEFKEHGDDEERHMMKIAARISQLGGNPDFNPTTVAERTATLFGRGTTLAEMIQEDLIEERVAIMVYRKLINWFGNDDPTTRRMLEAILKDEEDHADDLAGLL